MTTKDLELGLVTVEEVMAYLQVGRSTVYLLMRRNRLPWVRGVLGRSRRIPKAALLSLVQKNLTPCTQMW